MDAAEGLLYPWFTAAVYDYTSGHPTSGSDLVFDENQTLYTYNPSTDTYTVLSNTLPYMDSTPIWILIQCITIWLWKTAMPGGYHLRIINIDSCNGKSCKVTNLDNTASCTGTLRILGWYHVGLQTQRDGHLPLVNELQRSRMHPPFNTVYLLNPDPNNPVTITYQGQQQTIQPQQCFAASYGPTPPQSFGPGVYSRFKYYPNEDVYLYIPDPTNLWILRLEQ